MTTHTVVVILLHVPGYCHIIDKRKCCVLLSVHTRYCHQSDLRRILKKSGTEYKQISSKIFPPVCPDFSLVMTSGFLICVHVDAHVS